VKKIYCAVFALVIFAIPFAATAQSNEEAIQEKLDKMIDQWKRKFAAPSYGVTLVRFRFEQDHLSGVNSFFGSEDFYTLAMDLRIFRGINVSQRGGFYTGVEVGTMVLLGGEESFPDTGDVDDSTDAGPITPFAWEVNVEPHGASVFVMAKYGLRMDIGMSLMGFSAGFDMGFGISLNDYEYDLFTDDGLNRYDDGGGKGRPDFSIITEVSLEGAIRFGKNFRLFIKPSILYLPIKFEEDEEEFMSNPVGDGFINSPEDYLRYASGNYRLEQEGPIINARIGFSLNFD
jgi:hypothetical protein